MTPLLAEIIAICSAMGWAGDSVLVRFGLHQSNIFAAMLVSYSVSITCMWSYLIATTSLEFLKSPAMVYYVISGCMQPLFARALFYEGITRIGVARAVPLRGSEPLFATAIAIMVFHERPGWLVFFGTLLAMIYVATGRVSWLAPGRCAFADQRRVHFGGLAKSAQARVENYSRSVRRRGRRHHGFPDSPVGVCVQHQTRRAVSNWSAQLGIFPLRRLTGDPGAGCELHCSWAW